MRSFMAQCPARLIIKGQLVYRIRHRNAESDQVWTVPTRVTEAPSSNLYPQGSCPLKHLTLLPKVPHMSTTTNDRLAGRMAGRGRVDVPQVRGGE